MPRGEKGFRLAVCRLSVSPSPSCSRRFLRPVPLASSRFRSAVHRRSLPEVGLSFTALTSLVLLAHTHGHTLPFLLATVRVFFYSTTRLLYFLQHGRFALCQRHRAMRSPVPANTVKATLRRPRERECVLSKTLPPPKRRSVVVDVCTETQVALASDY